jgi:hypothetical protein
MNKTLNTIAVLSLFTVSSHATVYFQNTGTKAGWDTVYTQHQGTIDEVSSPSYKGNCLQFRQVWDGVLDGYHSECVKTGAQTDGTDRYYGKVIRFHDAWTWEDANYTFSQWSPENPSGPWCLMFLQNQTLRIQKRVGGYSIVDLGTVGRGVWINIVVRFNMSTTTGAQEVWVNGVKKFSGTGSVDLPGSTARWSNGIYCTQWRTEVPPSYAWGRTLYQDHFRIASSYAEANPSSW